MLPPWRALHALLIEGLNGDYARTPSRARYAARELRGLYDQQIARQLVEELLRRISDKHAFQSGSGDRAHHDDVAVRLACGILHGIDWMASDEVPASGRDRGRLQNAVEGDLGSFGGCSVDPLRC